MRGDTPLQQTASQTMTLMEAFEFVWSHRLPQHSLELLPKFFHFTNCKFHHCWTVSHQRTESASCPLFGDSFVPKSQIFSFSSCAHHSATVALFFFIRFEFEFFSKHSSNSRLRETHLNRHFPSWQLWFLVRTLSDFLDGRFCLDSYGSTSRSLEVDFVSFSNRFAPFNWWFVD